VRLLEDYEMSIAERTKHLKARINEAWDDPRPSRPAAEVFDRIEATHAKAVRAAKKSRG
jgi:hypothetical protein